MVFSVKQQCTRQIFKKPDFDKKVLLLAPRFGDTKSGGFMQNLCMGIYIPTHMYILIYMSQQEFSWNYCLSVHSE